MTATSSTTTTRTPTTTAPGKRPRPTVVPRHHDKVLVDDSSSSSSVSARWYTDRRFLPLLPRTTTTETRMIQTTTTTTTTPSRGRHPRRKGLSGRGVSRRLHRRATAAAPTTTLLLLLLPLVLLSLALGHSRLPLAAAAAASSSSSVLPHHPDDPHQNTNPQEQNWLTADSVVLLLVGQDAPTASLLASEVALALYRLFDCHVVLVDNLDGSHHDRQDAANDDDDDEQIRAQLFGLEYQRQSLFRVWQELDDHLSFYRMDPRPIIPEIDPGTTVDRLAHVFAQHRPTHVLVLPPSGWEQQQQRRRRRHRGGGEDPQSNDEPPRAGLLEGVLQQARSYYYHHYHHHSETTVRLPHVVWTSSEHVYPPTGVWNETTSTTTTDGPPPVPLHPDGAEAMVNEVIARSFDAKGIPSVALRMSKQVYGPFHDLSTPLFALLEKALRRNSNTAEMEEAVDMSSSHEKDDVDDFLFVDDAVDAILAALQLPYQPHTFAINVASGQSAMTLPAVQTVLQTVASGESVKEEDDEKTESVHDNPRRLDISLAQQVLNFVPRVSFTEGLQRTLAWHYDRMFPYEAEASDELAAVRAMAAKYGMASCMDDTDTECLKGVPIFPCASECAHSEQCRPTVWDVVLPKIAGWTASCPVVLYTIRSNVSPGVLDQSAADVPSVWPDAHCNIAFVPEMSPGELFIQQEWTIVPLGADPTDLDTWLVPLWSPGKLFPQSQWAIYTPPGVAFEELDRLLDHVQMPAEGAFGGSSVAMMLGRQGESGDQPRVGSSSQRQAYRAIHIKLSQFMDNDRLHDGFLSDLDAESWIVHRLGHSDSEQLRCDICKEVSGWNGMVDFTAAAGFVFGVHDVMSQVLASEKGARAFWYDEKMTQGQNHRRLEEGVVGVEDASSNGGNEADASSFQVEDSEEEELQEVHHFDHTGFGVTRKSLRLDVGNGEDPNQQELPGNTEESIDGGGDDSVAEESEPLLEDQVVEAGRHDVWLGVLSSTSSQMLVRIVQSESVGAISLNEHDNSRTS